MDASYPPELTSPPVPLVALLGRPDLHLLIGDYLRNQNVPRIVAIGLPDPLQAPAKYGACAGRGGAGAGRAAGRAERAGARIGSVLQQQEALSWHSAVQASCRQ